MIVDAHQHFWKIDRGIYDWIDDSILEIRRDYQPEHLAPYLDHFDIDRTILVQAAETLLENNYMIEAAEQNEFVGGIVAWVDLTSDDCTRELELLAEKSIVKGIRPVLQGIEDDDWILQDRVIENLKHLPSLNLRFDALIQPRHLKPIQTLGLKIPDLKIVIDHAAKPIIRDGQKPDQLWHQGMIDLSENPNIFCKLSGIVTEYGAGWTDQALKPIADHLLEVFSPSHVMWGSDWPVLEIDGSYAQWFTSVKSLISSLSVDESNSVLGNTATTFYGIE